MIEQAWNYKSVVAKDSNNTGGSSSGDSIKFEYYKIDWDKLNELGFDKNDNSIEGFSMQVKGILFSSLTAKIVVGGNAFGGINMSGSYAATSFIYYAIAISFASPIKALNPDGTETIISNIKESFSNTTNTDWLIPITEEEYYNIDGLMPV